MRSLGWMLAAWLFMPVALADEGGAPEPPDIAPEPPDEAPEPPEDEMPEEAPAPAPAAPREPVASRAPSAEQAVAEVTALEAKVEQHKKDKDDRGLLQDLGEVTALHKRVVDRKTKERLNAILGVILEATQNDTLKKGVFKAIGDIGDPANWRHVRPYLRQPDPKAGPPLLKEAIECAGRLRAEEAIEPLLLIVENSKVYLFAGAAMTALGNFGDVKHERVRILGALVGEIRRSVPSAGGRGPASLSSGSGDTARWDALSGVFLAAANNMTGKNVGSAEDWIQIYKDSKGREGALFER